MRMQTQWTVSMSGAVGLRYEAAYPLIDRATDSATEWDAMFEAIQALERGALEQMSRDKTQ